MKTKASKQAQYRAEKRRRQNPWWHVNRFCLKRFKDKFGNVYFAKEPRKPADTDALIKAMEDIWVKCKSKPTPDMIVTTDQDFMDDLDFECARLKAETP